jgi:hypothetical protein
MLLLQAICKTTINEDRIPDAPIPFIFGLGHVIGPIPMVESAVKCVAVTLAEYVRDEQHSSIVQYVSSSRAHVQLSTAATSTPPNQGGQKHPSRHVGAERVLSVQMDSLALNVGPTSTIAVAPPRPSTSSSSPAKKRKFIVLAAPFVLINLSPSILTL